MFAVTLWWHTNGVTHLCMHAGECTVWSSNFLCKHGVLYNKWKNKWIVHRAVESSSEVYNCLGDSNHSLAVL